MPEKIKTSKLSREHFSVGRLGDESDKGYWKTRSAEERLEYMLYLRRLNYGDAVMGKMEEGGEVVELKNIIETNNPQGEHKQ